jgi:hypothetical protein
MEKGDEGKGDMECDSGFGDSEGFGMGFEREVKGYYEA